MSIYPAYSQVAPGSSKPSGTRQPVATMPITPENFSQLEVPTLRVSEPALLAPGIHIPAFETVFSLQMGRPGKETHPTTASSNPVGAW